MLKISEFLTEKLIVFILVFRYLITKNNNCSNIKLSIMVAQTFNLNIREAQADGSLEIEARLV